MVANPALTKVRMHCQFGAGSFYLVRRIEMGVADDAQAWIPDKKMLGTFVPAVDHVKPHVLAERSDAVRLRHVRKELLETRNVGCVQVSSVIEYELI